MSGGFTRRVFLSLGNIKRKFLLTYLVIGIYLARELHRRRWQHCRVVESSSWGPGSDVALVLFLAAIHRYPRKLVRPLLNCWTFFAVFNSLGKLFHFSTTLTVKKLVLVSSLVLGITSLCGSPVLYFRRPKVVVVGPGEIFPPKLYLIPSTLNCHVFYCPIFSIWSGLSKSTPNQRTSFRPNIC